MLIRIFNIAVKARPFKRRGILSIVSSIYDPLGLATPFTLPAKVLLQELCRKGLDWDAEISDVDRITWERWLNNLTKLGEFAVPRCIKPLDFGDVVESQLHHFSDASQSAYAAASYIRIRNNQDQVHCLLLAGKSRLALIKTITIPRLELAAATVAIQLDRTLKRELEFPICSSTFWTDSTTVLQYLKNDSKRFHTYVANRVAFIRSNSSPEQWRYVSTKNNPADEASRGSSQSSFLLNDRWKNGPAFLRKPDAELFATQNQPVIEDLTDMDPEVKRDVASFSSNVVESSDLMKIFSRFSSWARLKKFIAWCLRCQTRFRKSHVQNTAAESGIKVKENITVEEMKTAEEEIGKYIQKEAFQDEVQALGRKPKGNVKKSSSLFKLDPVLHNGLIRVGGRLNKAPLSSDAKNPIILPKKNPIVDLIVEDFHSKLGHSGREHVLSAVRERYWIIHGNSTVRRVLSNCFDCKRRQAKVAEQKMGDLSYDRVNPGQPPFTRVGVDYFGPFLVREKRSMVKRYGVIFTCLAIRAIHLEVARTLDTNSFIMALRRFIARRGQVKEIRSDNGTNLVGGEKELHYAIQEWNQNQIHQFLLQHEVKWTFNPPTGSHHGGVWERCIRTVRKILSALVKEQTLNDEGLSTLLCEVEAIVNSRPLTTVSSDPKDLEP